MSLDVRRLNAEAQLPRRCTEFAAGFDLYACLTESRSLVIDPGRRKLIPTGIALAIPESHEGQIRPRSGLALLHGVTILNAPGTIDADYRGEIQVLLVNLGDKQFEIHHGDRIAQLVLAAVSRMEPRWVDELAETVRGTSGFGSTGRSD